MWPDETTALAYEMYQIDFWGRKDLGTGCLINLTDGGENPPLRVGCKPTLGRKQTEEEKRRRSLSMRLAWAKGRHAGMSGKRQSTGTRALQAEAGKAQATTVGNRFRGKPWSEARRNASRRIYA